MRASDVFPSASRLQCVVSRTPKVCPGSRLSVVMSRCLSTVCRGAFVLPLRRHSQAADSPYGFRPCRAPAVSPAGQGCPGDFSARFPIRHVFRLADCPLFASVVIHKAHDVGGARDPSCLASMPDSQVLLKRWGEYYLTVNNLSIPIGNYFL